ncbi:hypothetical protein N2152v2_001330 [Parachlorella kessleri]
MGPSGAGKSTLLNALAFRLDKGVQLEGKLRLNGQPYNTAELKQMSGYVMQDDLLNGHLTVEETLTYTARLRLDRAFTEAQRTQRIEEVIKECNLSKCRRTIVGSPLRKGISGGERKRLCVAMDLLTRPQLLFLDEPTSGLDSVTALSLCTTLRELTLTLSCTILCTLHQPSAKIFSLFDSLILLQNGRQVYHGPPTDAVHYFASHGFPCPPLTNPADHVMDIITPQIMADGKVASHLDLATMDATVTSFRLTENPLSDPSGKELGLALRERIAWTRQYQILLGRCLREQGRKWKTLFALLLQSMAMAALIGSVFFQIGTSQVSITKRQPVLFFCTINQGMFGALGIINSFPSERVLTLRERASGMYYASAYFLAKMTAETFIYVLSPVFFSCIAYWMVGLQPVAGKFFIFTGFMVLCQLSATSMALAISAVCREVDLSVAVLPMALEVSRLFGGFFLAPAMDNAWAVWLDAISYVRYCYIGISLNELTGLELTCTANDVAKGTCVTSGQQTIDKLGLDYLSIGACAGILVGYIVVCRTIAYLGIRFLKW